MRADDETILDLNNGFSRLLGYEREHAIGETARDLNFWHKNSDHEIVVTRLQTSREVTDFETTLRTISGALVHVEISLRYVEIDNELCVLCIGRDITKRISAEAALVESEEKVRQNI